MWFISKWPVPPYIKGVIIYNILSRSRKNSKDEKNIAAISQKMTIHYLTVLDHYRVFFLFYNKQDK